MICEGRCRGIHQAREQLLFILNYELCCTLHSAAPVELLCSYDFQCACNFTTAIPRLLLSSLPFYSRVSEGSEQKGHFRDPQGFRTAAGLSGILLQGGLGTPVQCLQQTVYYIHKMIFATEDGRGKCAAILQNSYFSEKFTSAQFCATADVVCSMQNCK